MASVRMTNELRYTIRLNAEKAYLLSSPEPKPNNEYIALVVQAAVNEPAQKFLQEMKTKGEELSLKSDQRYGGNILPQASAQPITQLILRCIDNDNDRRRDYKESYIYLNTPLKDYLQVTPTTYRDPILWIEDCHHSEQTKLREHFEAHRTSKAKWSDAVNDYKSSIYNLVSKCTTLKQLLEVWPAAESLVPHDKIQQMHTKVTRADRAAAIKEEVCFDPTIANQAVLTAKMLGG